METVKLRVRKATGPIANYLSFLLFLIRDSALRYAGGAAYVFALSAFGVASKIFAFLVMISYASALSSNVPALIFGHQFGVRGSFIDLFIALAACSFALIASAISVFFAKKHVIELGRRYEIFCATRILETISPQILLTQKFASPKLTARHLLSLARKDSIVRGRSFRILLELTYPLVTFVVASGVILWLNISLTIAVATIGCLSLIAQARISRGVAAASIEMERSGREAAGTFRQFIQDRLNHSREKELSSEAIYSPDVVSFMCSFDRRLRAIEYSRFVSSIIYPLIISLILLVLGGEIILEGAGWELLLVYLVASRFALTGLQGVLIGLTSLNRFYPQLLRYWSFVGATKSSS